MEKVYEGLNELIPIRGSVYQLGDKGLVLLDSPKVAQLVSADILAIRDRLLYDLGALQNVQDLQGILAEASRKVDELCRLVPVFPVQAPIQRQVQQEIIDPVSILTPAEEERQVVIIPKRSYNRAAYRSDD